MDDVRAVVAMQVVHVGGGRGVMHHHFPAKGSTGEDVGGDDRWMEAVVSFHVNVLMDRMHCCHQVGPAVPGEWR